MQTVGSLPANMICTFKGYDSGYELWTCVPETGVQGGYDSAFSEPNYRIKIKEPKTYIGSFMPNLPATPISVDNKNSGEVKKETKSEIFISNTNVKNDYGLETNTIIKETKKMEYFDYKFLLICFAITIIIVLKRTA